MTDVTVFATQFCSEGTKEEQINSRRQIGREQFCVMSGGSGGGHLCQESTCEFAGTN